jgi:mono/diheme cytochrome c family protein
MKPPPRKYWSTLGLAVSLLWLTAATAMSPRFQGQAATPDQAAFFEAKIRPVLIANCSGCHGAAAQLANLRLDSLAGLQKGGDSGPAVVPGDPDKSLLIQAIRQSGPIKMPKGGKLKPEEIADLESWVKMGAPWPAATEKKPDALWSLQPVKKPAVPKVKHSAQIRNPIDAFVIAKLETSGQTLAAEADRRTLIRRLTYDLIGLPPTAAEVDAFLADKSPDAYEKVVDRLLASPHYGERWARLWLDVARYADTKGYVFEEDRNYYNAYTYRDWVINSFNKDLPYDQFVIQQLAADRLPEVQNGDDKSALAALGFLTIGRRFLNVQADIIDDRIDVTMRGFEGFTVACARCHDHKFDPIPTQDYYSLYAVFNSSAEVQEPISEKSVRDPWIQSNQRLTAVDGTIRQLVVAQVKRLRQMVLDPEQQKTLSAEVKATLQNLREEVVPEGDNLVKLVNAFEAAERDRLQHLRDDRAEIVRSMPSPPEFAMAMVDRPNPADGFIFKRGNPGSPGGPAPRRFLLALSKPDVEREHWEKDSGRLELAKAIASRDNPLTARVFVNRVWQNHFGQGIVRTPSDFGHQGERPTHPELLDYLASTFMDGAWSIKKLQRLIVTSETYRQTSNVSQAAYNADPENRSLNRMNRRRLDLEQMRDSLMLAAGRLDLSKIGGKSVDIWAQPFAQRRAVYGFIERQNLPGTFRTFDFASPDSTSPHRFMTTVPQQALFFMNSPLSVEEARALAERPEIQGSADDPQRVRRLYRLLFGRLPDAEELAAGVAYLKLPSTSSPLANPWSYGYGGFDAAHGKTVGFTSLPLINGQYRPGKAFPDPVLGFMVLVAKGGHPGHDVNHAVIRRWTAPTAMTVQISGSLGHAQAQGDGVRARVISSRLGSLGEWPAHNASVRTDIASVAVEKGDTLDFAVDPTATDAFDAFSWSLAIKSVDGKMAWDDTSTFGKSVPAPLSRVALYAQALMMTNEFVFVD